MKKCLTWSDRFRDTNRSPVRTFGSSRYARVSSAHLPKELARIPPPKEDEMSLRAAEVTGMESRVHNTERFGIPITRSSIGCDERNLDVSSRGG